MTWLTTVTGAMNSPKTKYNFSESVKSTVEQSLKKIHLDFGLLNETYYLVCLKDITLIKKYCISFVK